MVTFHLMANSRPARERNHSFFVKTKYQHPLSHSEGHNQFIVHSSRAAVLIVWLYYLIASCLAPSLGGVRANRALRGQCVTPCGGENNVRTHDWLPRIGTCTWQRLQTTLAPTACAWLAERTCGLLFADSKDLTLPTLTFYVPPFAQVPECGTIK